MTMASPADTDPSPLASNGLNEFCQGLPSQVNQPAPSNTIRVSSDSIPNERRRDRVAIADFLPLRMTRAVTQNRESPLIIKYIDEQGKFSSVFVGRASASVPLDGGGRGALVECRSMPL